MLTVVLKQLQSDRHMVRKRASTCLGALAVVCSDVLFDKLVKTILLGVETPGSDLVSLIQTIGTISRTVGYLSLIHI